MSPAVWQRNTAVSGDGNGIWGYKFHALTKRLTMGLQGLAIQRHEFYKDETLAADPEGASASFLAGGGEMGALLRAKDWSQTELGAPDRWPQSLKTALRIMLTSRQPIWVGWGAELFFFYNDAYKAIIGRKHPWALGLPTAEVWHEIWPDIEPLLATAMGGVEGTYVEDQLLIMERNGYPEETYYTFSYSPIPRDDDRTGGIICANTDDTQRVIGERQLALLRDLSAATAQIRACRDVCANAATALASNPHDLAFALIYMTDSEPGVLSLFGAAGIDAGHPAAPALIELSSPGPWPLAEVLSTRELRVVGTPAAGLGVALPTGYWTEPVEQVALLPVMPAGETGRRGVLVVGLNRFRLFDRDYRDFLALVAGQLAAAVANADAYEQERRRAESLAEIDRVKTNFFSNVSHEFRTPLTLMLGPLEEALAQAAGLPFAERERLRLVHRNGMRLLKLVNSLLDFSRMEAGRVRAVFEPTDLAALTADVASNFRSAMDKADLRFDIDFPPGLPRVHVDRDMWEKIVLNLVSNAFKFTFEGGIRLSLSSLGGVLEFKVEDTGTGIAAAELSRLFERFHRIEGARGRSFEGSGIGLALVRELVDAHGGSIRVDSEEGRGSAFYVSIPMGTAQLPPAQVRAERVRASSGSVAQAFVEEALRWLPSGTPPPQDLAETQVIAADSFRPERVPRSRILLADDNADMRDYIAQLLGARHECRATHDGQMALEMIRESRPDLLLTDIMMPRLNGFALIKAIRADPELRDLPVIVISARAGEESSVEGLAAGADDYLVKPFSARELIARVDGVLAMARVRRDMGDSLRAQVAARTAELEAANAQLRREALEREKMEQALRQSQKMEAVGKLTGGVAHDFNNLLQVIGGNLQLLSKDVAGSERAQRRLTHALAGVTRGSKLAAQLLAFGRRQPLAPKVVNLGRFINGLDDLLRRALGDGIEIDTVIGAGLWNSLVDPSQVENALLNLAINARDAMNGHGRLTIEAGNAALTDHDVGQHDELRPGHYVMLAVTDTGCGMTPDIVEHVFEPFFTTKPEGQGTGLGLSMVYGFVRQSDGHIKIHSEPDRGTTVRIYLPRAEAAEDVAADADTGPIMGGTEMVLVVEDDDEVRSTVVELLADLGYRVLRAREAQSALAIIESGATIDLLFTDVVMPGPLRSAELARQARSRLPDLAVLFTSGYTDDAIVHGGRLDDGIELLSKPYSREDLARKIRHVLRNQQQRPMPLMTLTGEAARSRILKILLVEDDDLIRMATTDLLQSLGHTVYEAGAAAPALVSLARQPVDILLTDVGLPDMSGTQLAAAARRAAPGLKIIFATGADGVPLKPGELNSGLDPYAGVFLLRKPYDADALDRVLRAAGERRGAA
jgi:signal transduction histidine kinase/PAS domain-containing protein